MKDEDRLRERVTVAVREVLDAGADLGITVTAEQVANAVLDVLRQPNLS